MNKVTRERWLAAQGPEKAVKRDAERMKEWLRVRRQTWPALLDYLKSEISLDGSTRILDIGGGPTTIFLGLREGQRYMVDPTWEVLFETHSFMREVEEYKDVTFISKPIEDAVIDQHFDVVFMINVLDHVGDIQGVAARIDELLAPSGTAVIIVDCYADRWVRNIIRFFDADVPHPHHFLNEDIIRLFADYTLQKQDDSIFELLSRPAFRGATDQIEIYRIDKFIRQMWRDLELWGKKGNIFFAARFALCYGLSLLVASLRRRESPPYPLKRCRLFVFRKD